MIESIFVLLVFAVFAYVIHMRVRKSAWPKLRSPFYYED